MALDISGIVLPGDIAAEQYNHVDVFTQQYYVNQFPLISRLPRVPVDTQTFIIRHTKYRPQQYTFTSAMNGTDVYSVVSIQPQVQQPGIETGDESALMAGDVLEIVTGGVAERVEVIAVPASEIAALPKLPLNQVIPAVGTVLVRRGAENTAIAAHATTDGYLTLIGNSRDGGEVFQTGIRARPINVTQYCQTFQAPVQIGGSVQSSAIVGVPNPLAKAKMDQLTNLMRDMEKSSFYGYGEGFINGNIRLKQIGVRQQCTTNRIMPTGGSAAPTNAANYLPANFVADVLQPLWNIGGEPDVMFCSSTFLAGIDGWGTHVLRLDEASNKFGVRVEAYQSSLAPGLTIVPCTTLKPGSAFVGQSDLMFWRNKRNEFWQPRGFRGDAMEGDWIAEGAVEVRDEEKHAWIEGITNFGVPT